ncbi:MAG: ribonuclease HI, partial [Clostridia bacterium]|nr:ribonuclease HI [Clostridia bacterium]
MKELKHVDIFTDGACSGNPGPGGWGAVLRYGKYEIEISGGEKLTTNNRMELTALISALKKLKEKCEITIYTDSKYIADAFNEGWVSKWILSGWRKADKSPVLNVELWQELVELINVHEFELIWVKGHVGHPEN